MAWPTVAPSPFTRLNTPFGTPAACRTSAKMIAFNGAISLGLSTMVQPAARAGATLHVIWLMGQFHGVMNPQTPIGSRMIRVLPCMCSNSYSPSTAIICFRWPTPVAAWALVASVVGAPISWEIAFAMSS